MDKDKILDLVDDYAYSYHQEKVLGDQERYSQEYDRQVAIKSKIESLLDEGDLLTRLFESTKAFYERFPGEWTVEDALRKFAEESMEFTIEAMVVDPDSIETGEFFKEMIDVIVTMLSVTIKLGLTVDKIADAILFVIMKNDAKNAETHERVNGQITRRK